MILKDHLDYGVLLCENNCCTTFVWFAFTLYFFNSMCYQTKLIEYCFMCSISEKCLTVFLFFCLTVFGKSNSKTSVWSNKISVWKRRKKCLIRQKNKKTRSVNGPLVPEFHCSSQNFWWQLKYSGNLIMGSLEFQVILSRLCGGAN